MASVRHGEKPASCTSAAYVPGGSIGIEKRPSALLVAVQVVAVSARRMVTAAPDAGALCGSVTRPERVATAGCASATRAPGSRAARQRAATARQGPLKRVIGRSSEMGLDALNRPARLAKLRQLGRSSGIAVFGHQS